MIFSSPIFLFAFLPLVLTLYPFFMRFRLGNLWLLGMSIVFYAWGEPIFLFLMLGSTLVNYVIGYRMDSQVVLTRRKSLLIFGIVFNLGLLVYFKYVSFFVNLMDWPLKAFGLGPFHLEPAHLPIGISFFTFHALSYLIDIYRRKTPAAHSPLNVGLYIFFFPQLIAGPILRWGAMAPQIARPAVNQDRCIEGIRRFIYGLAKKMLLANTVAVPADQIFSLPSTVLSPALAWFGALCYTLQIYYDFSGYSDMAIGMGKMFGFEFVENFNHPYVAQSIRDFWHRWHISLSTWFREYLYIPLGGNRISQTRTCLNLLLVFFLCGLWHGAGSTFVVWGLYQGAFLILERARFGSVLESLPQFFRHLYALVVIMVGWVIFRSDTLLNGATFLKAMFGFGQGETTDSTWDHIFTNEIVCAIAAGIVFSAPFGPWLKGELIRLMPARQRMLDQAGIAAEPVVLAALLVVSAAWLAGSTYNPFIYFRF